nr:unnamed protein product [Naegleria fowleri]
MAKLVKRKNVIARRVNKHLPVVLLGSRCHIPPRYLRKPPKLKKPPAPLKDERDWIYPNTYTVQDFLMFYKVLDAVAKVYERPPHKEENYPPVNNEDSSYLYTHLKYIIYKESKTKGCCIFSKYKKGSRTRTENVCFRLPMPIIKCIRKLNLNWRTEIKQPSVPATWITYPPNLRNQILKINFFSRQKI